MVNARYSLPQPNTMLSVVLFGPKPKDYQFNIMHDGYKAQILTVTSWNQQMFDNDRNSYMVIKIGSS